MMQIVPVIDNTESEISIPPMRPQTLGPKQIAWLDDKFRYFGVYRKQAEAQTGVAAIDPSKDAA